MSGQDKYENNESPLKWHELLRLVRNCPPVVNGQDITARTRLLFWALAQNADGPTCET
jgi:hypothetical protein